MSVRVSVCVCECTCTFACTCVCESACTCTGVPSYAQYLASTHGVLQMRVHAVMGIVIVTVCACLPGIQGTLWCMPPTASRRRSLTGLLSLGRGF